MTNFPSTTDGRPVQRRIGDAERDRCVEDLSASFTAGRLTQGEFERRSLLAFEAATVSDLAVLTEDLTEAQPSSDIAAKSSSADLVLRRADLAKTGFFLTAVGAVTFIATTGDIDVWFGWWFFGAVTGGVGALLGRGRSRSR
ncbi:MAG: DUF1707 SHOCT-like domain-containing protein [Propionibacteriaceae bacterium]